MQGKVNATTGQVFDGTKVIFESLGQTLTKFTNALPTILGALLVFIIGWIIARVLRGATKKLLGLAKFDDMTQRVGLKDMFDKANITTTPTAMISKFVYWLVMFFVFVAVTNQLGLTVISEKLGEMINFLPSLFVAMIIFTLGILFAGFVRDLVRAASSSMGASTGNIISGFAFYFIATFTTLTALQQVGIDTSVVTNNISIILGAVLLAAAIAYGFAARDLLTNLLSGYFSKSKFEVGQRIRVTDVEGKITKLDNISVTIQTANDTVVIPVRKLTENNVHLLG